MNQELVTYIVLGSESRLKNIKLPLANKYEEYLLANFSSNTSYQNQLDDLVTRSKGEVVVFLPPSSFPNIEAKEALKKIALIGLSSWGWFEYSLKRKNILQNIKKITTLVRSIPDIEQVFFLQNDYIFLLVALVHFLLKLFLKYQKDYIHELIHKSHFQLL